LVEDMSILIHEDFLSLNSKLWIGTIYVE